MYIQGCQIDSLVETNEVSIAPPLGCVFEVKSSKSPRVPPPLPARGVVEHTIDRCINIPTALPSLHITLLCNYWGEPKRAPLRKNRCTHHLRMYATQR